ncbi:endonuclease domain-containing protein [Streptomyces fulvoviolaceus]|uniref:endonuclease domain-containing protein n=2 Tax=Streptomyces fulvoviolaceus TaxID=285535 RepID=UPI0036F1BED8
MPEHCTFAPKESPVGPCGNPTVADGLCNGHYQQKQRRGRLVPLHTLRASQESVAALRELGLKRCTDCGEVKRLEEFSLSSAAASGRSTYCNECGPEHAIMSRYKFPSVAAVREFRTSRDYRCDICQRRWEEGQPAFHIDHDRSCCEARRQCCGRCIRGFLCGPCNTLGLAWYEMVGRQVTTIPQFEEYLLRYERRRSAPEFVRTDGPQHHYY